MSNEETSDNRSSKSQSESIGRETKSPRNEDYVGVAADPQLTEDLALQLLKQTDLSSEVFERLHKSATVAHSRKVKLALLSHAKIPRHISLPMLPHLFTFDLMQVALQPAVAADIKVAAENSLIHRLEKLSMGEKLSLARRASRRIAEALLKDGDLRVARAALENSRLTEASILKTISLQKVSRELIETISFHSKWSLRGEIRIALLRHRHTSEDKAREFANDLTLERLREVLLESELSEPMKSRLLSR